MDRAAAITNLGLYGRLAELRARTGRDRKRMARRMEATLSWVYNLEKAEDPRVSSLLRYVDAVGGRLELLAVLDDGEVFALTESGWDLEALRRLPRSSRS